MRDSLKLTVYFGERDRNGGRFFADHLLERFAAHEVATSALFRGIEGFGLKHHLQTERLLSLSEDLPIVAVAVDEAARIRRLADEVGQTTQHGLITLERARLLTDGLIDADIIGDDSDETKLTVYVGRGERIDSRPAYERVVRTLHDCGVAGATAILGVDGTVHGVRQRARFFAANRQVPMMIISVGAKDAIARALPELAALLPRPLATVERAQVCKRDGCRLSVPIQPPDESPALWQKLTVYSSERAQHHGRPLHSELMRRLRAEGALGATALRGFWGYHGDHAPHGDQFWSLRRRVPVLTVVVDRPDRTRRWFQVVDELTQSTGLVTAELTPAPPVRRLTSRGRR